MEHNTLYVVGTPIGNMGDMSPRAVEVLESVDFIAAEDTRVTVKLLNHFNIKKPMVSYFEHNTHDKGEKIIERILSGESCAVVTDAGMPCISDPGEDLIRQCEQAGIRTVVVPGPSAAISALAVSGLETGRFTFEGFLSVNKKSRSEHLESLRDERRTMIFYEAPHKLPNTLKDFFDNFGDRKLTIARELTKLHEEIIRTTTEEIDMQAFDNVVDKIIDARHIYIMGLRSASPIAQFLAYYLNFIFDNVRIVSEASGDVFEQISRINESDLLFGISFPRYSTRTLEAMSFAKARGAQVVGLTDGPMSPICAASTVCLTARTDMASFVDSMAAPLSVINALIVALGLRRKEELSEHFRLMEGIWDEYRVYVGKDKA